MIIIELNIPEYTIDTEPDNRIIGKVVDDEIKKHFLDQSVVIRGVASSEHADKTKDGLIEVIKQTGTDRYDPERAGDRYENVEGKHIDLFGVPVTITAGSEVFKVLVWGFYHSAIAVHGYPVRIDIVTIYDGKLMEQVPHQYEGRDDVKDDGFAFRYPERKQETLLGIIMIK